MGTLRDAGYPFTFLDGVVQDLARADVVRRVALARPDVVGLHCNAMTRVGVCQTIRELRAATEAGILVGGPGTLDPAPYLEAGADVVLVGEAEGRLVRVIDAMTGRGSWDGLLGIHRRGPDGGIVRTAPAPFAEDLDTLPTPHRPPELVPLYGEPVNPAQRGTYITVMMGRGCPYRCTYCASEEIWGGRVRLRSVDHVLAEIDDVLDRWPDAYITFVDDVFAPRADRARELCERLLARRRRFGWTCILHPKTYAGHREEIFGLMARAGCNCISFGAQSAVPRVLENIRRHPDEPAHLAKALATCRKHGILTVLT